MTTAEDIAREHYAAMQSLTGLQCSALDRIAMARNRTNFNGRRPDENLREMFAEEARRRNRRTKLLPA